MKPPRAGVEAASPLQERKHAQGRPRGIKQSRRRVEDSFHETLRSARSPPGRGGPRLLQRQGPLVRALGHKGRVRMVIVPPLGAVPQLAPCASSGRSWQLWLARRSQGRDRPTGRPTRAAQGRRLHGLCTFFVVRLYRSLAYIGTRLRELEMIPYMVQTYA